MITTFGNFGLDIQPSFCDEVYFDAGHFGGSATFLQCGSGSYTTIYLNPYEVSFSYCVESDSISTSGSVYGYLSGSCEDLTFSP
jgi:hypothetical protein